MNTTTQNNLIASSQGLILSQSILDVFVLQNLIDPQDADKLKKHFKTNREIENFLIKNRLVTRDTINKAYSILLKLPYIELKNVQISDEVLKIVPEKLARRFNIIPFSLSGGKTIKIAMARPADLMSGYIQSLSDLFFKKGLFVELFITGDQDFAFSIKQYNKKNSKDVLLQKGSLPVVFLRNQSISKDYIQKIPKEFIEKYRVVVFGQNMDDTYLIACQNPDSALTQKIIAYLEKENQIKLEAFATSKEDVDYVIENYDGEKKDRNIDKSLKQKDENEESINEMSSGKGDVKKSEKNANISSNESGEQQAGSSIKNLLKNFLSDPNPRFTMDNGEDRETFVDNIKQSIPVEKKNQNKDESGTPSNALIKEKEEAENKEKENTGKESNTAPKTGEKDQTEKVADKQNLEDKDLGQLIDGDIKESAQLDEIVKEAYVPKIVAALINFALNKRSSDLHIEPQNKSLRARCRIDGILTDMVRMPLNLHPPIISRIKILAKLKIDETRVPQDGRFDLTFKDKEVDVRVSSLPTVHGEKIVLRILDKNQRILSLEDLGMQGSALDKTIAAIAKPWGIILSTGPTGSGKSTTLNAILNRLNAPGINIVTLEDPVEYETPGINQCQVKPEIGFTFANGLRSVLRQDPNIIMVGEIRDAETAGMVTHAALTGHLVLSTLHTNDTSGSLPRLINMGIEPFLITSAIDLVIAQRLVRKICAKCKEEVKLPAKVMEEIKKEIDKMPANSKDRSLIPPELKFHYGRGCSECNQGYKGRIGLFEVLSMTPKIEDLAVGRRPSNEIKEASISEGMVTMKQDGILKALQGLTTIDEVFQATMSN